MTEIQKKAISHCLKELNNIETYKVYTDIREKLVSSGINEDTCRLILKTLELSHKENITNHTQSVRGWLNAILEDK